MKVAKSHNSVHPMGVHDNGNKGGQCGASLQVTMNKVEVSELSSSTSKDFSVSRSAAQSPPDDTTAGKDGDNFSSSKGRLFRCILRSNPRKVHTDLVKIKHDKKGSKQSIVASIHDNALSPSLTVAGVGLVDLSRGSALPYHNHGEAGSTVLAQTPKDIQVHTITKLTLAPDHHVASPNDSTTNNDQSRLYAPAYNRSQGEGLTADCTRKRRRKKNYSVSSKAVRSLLIVVLAFFICMAPFSCTKLYKVIVPKKDALPDYINLVASVFQFCSSAVNPLIYGIFRKDFRAGFLSLFNKLLARL